MALNIADPKLKLLYGLDEAGEHTTRVNSGSWGEDLDLSPEAADGVEGTPSVPDGHGGRAADTSATPSGAHSTQARWLQSDASGTIDGAWPYAPFDMASMGAGDAYVMGVRFKWVDFATGGGGGTDQHYLLHCNPAASVLLDQFSLKIQPDTNVGPAAAGKIRLELNNSAAPGNVGGAAWTETGSPASDYISDMESWYSVSVRVRWKSSGVVTYKVWVTEESTGALYTFEKDSATGVAQGFSSTYKAATLRWWLGLDALTSAARSHEGYIDNAFYYVGDLSDDDILAVVEDGINVPWVAPDYTYLPHEVRVTHANESSSFPIPRKLPLGSLACFHPAGAWGTRMKLRYSGTRPARPWALRRSEIQFDTQGPMSSQKNHSTSYDNAALGLIRVAGQLPSGSVVDVAEIDFSGLSPRRRPGFRVRRDVSDESAVAKNAFASFRSSDDELHRLYKVGTKIYPETGIAPTAISTGWNRFQQPSFAILDDRLLVMTRDKQASWRGNTGGMDRFGEDAPSTGSVASTVGTLTGTFEYAYTFFDPVTGDETAPKEVGDVTLATQGALISSMDTTPTDARFTQHRIYRTTNGGASPNYFFIDSQAIAMSYVDSGETDGTQAIGRVGSDFLTSTPPDTWGGVAVHSERAFYFLGEDFPNRVYWSEANDPLRWWAENLITFEAPVTAVMGRGQSLVVLTDRTVELIESDFVRDANGSVNISRTVISRTVGCPGPNAMVDVNGQPYWIDRRGIFTLRGDEAVKISENIDNLFRFMNMGEAESFCAGHNHIRRQVWFCVAMSDIQVDNTRQQTSVILQLGEAPKWSLYRPELTYCDQFDDDQNGIRFGGIDHLGVFKEFESFEGDGVDDPSEIASCEGTIDSISGNAVTVAGASPAWTTDEHRGKGVVLRDISTGAETYSTILTNDADSFTLADTISSALAAADEYEIGGMAAFLEFSEQHFSSSNFKTMRFLYHQFDDLTAGHFV